MNVTNVLKHLIPFSIIVFFLLIQTPRFEMPFVITLERIASDIRTRATLIRSPDERIAIIDVDENSIREFGQWPWPRETLARLVDNLFDYYHAGTLGFDIIFAEPEQDSVREKIRALSLGPLSENLEFQKIAAVELNKSSPDMIFATSFINRSIVTGVVFSTSDTLHINSLPESLAEIPPDIAARLPLIKPLGYTANIPLLEGAASGAGFFDNNTVDDDGVFRRVPLIQLYENNLYPSLALAVARAALNDLPYDIQLIKKDSYLAIEQFQLGSLLIPLDLQGTVQVPYRGPAGTFEYFSARDILNKELDQNLLTNRILLIGTSAAGLLDLRATPVGKNYPGVEVHANIISGILNQNFAAHPSWALSLNLILTLVAGLIMHFIVSRLKPSYSVLMFGLLVISLIYLNIYAWQRHFILDIISPLSTVVLMFVWQSTFGFFIETFNKRRITQQFGQYVPPDLVKEMVASSDDLSIKGENRNMTVLFSDVRGFTNLSEGLSPEGLSQMMNDLLTPLTRLIHENRGTIDKYMGDAIMAFWGAPLRDQHHARRAVKAAFEFQKSAEIMRADFINRGLPPLYIGIGVNTGDMSVGNMGSAFRMAYTVLGDAVNLGSRIEGLTKLYGVDILISEFTVESIDDLICRKIDLVRVKGKQEPVLLYEPIGFREEVPVEVIKQVALFNNFHDQYCAQNWLLAKKTLNKMSDSLHLQNALLLDMYKSRITQFQIEPPPSDWNGVFIHTSK